MQNQHRIDSILELLKLFNSNNKIASKLLNSYFRSHKYIGSRDRKFISNTFWNILRHRYKIHWHLNNLNLETTYEREIMLEFFFLNSYFRIKSLLISSILFFKSAFKKKNSNIISLSKVISRFKLFKCHCIL